jgi:hypothetical protein
MKPQKTGILLLALLLAAMVLVPIASADTAGTDLVKKMAGRSHDQGHKDR